MPKKCEHPCIHECVQNRSTFKLHNYKKIDGDGILLHGKHISGILRLFWWSELIWPYLTVCPEARFLKPGPDALNAAGVFWMNRGVSTDALMLLHQRVINQTWKSHNMWVSTQQINEMLVQRQPELAAFKYMQTCSKPVFDWRLLDCHGERSRGWRRLRPEQRTLPSKGAW